MSATGESLRLNPDECDHYVRTAEGVKCFQVDDNSSFVPGQTTFTNPYDYLRSVRHEAKNIPNVSRAHVLPPQTSVKMRDIKLFEKKTNHGSQYAPTPDTIIFQVEKFKQVRNLIHHHQTILQATKKTSQLRPKLPISPLPSWRDEEGWRYFSIGSDRKKKLGFVVKDEHGQVIKEKSKTVDVVDLTTTRETQLIGDNRSIFKPVEEQLLLESGSSKIELSQIKKGFPPLMRIVLRMDDKLQEAVLKYHIEWIDVYGYSHEQGSWIYALLSLLETPLLPTTIAIVRELSRRCAKEREAVADDKSLIASLNIIIVLIGKFFAQSDLLD